MQAARRAPRLQFHKETLRVLSDSELRRLGGGHHHDSSACIIPPPDSEDCWGIPTGSIYPSCTACSNC